MKKALVVLSGGQDSTTCLFWAKRQFQEVHAITFNYGQRHAREIQAARDVAKLAGVASHEVLDLGDTILKGTSPLTNKEAPLEQYESAAQMAQVIGNRIEHTFVPMRNALFLTVAANRAVVLGADHLVTGTCEEDNANYPDCRQTFISSQAFTVQLALGLEHSTGFFIDTPLMRLSKDATVRLAVSLGCFEHMAFTHTAYDGQWPPVGHDHATMLRADGFERAGLPDPLVVRAHMHGLMELPTTDNYQHTTIDMDHLRDRIRSLEAQL